MVGKLSAGVTAKRQSRAGFRESAAPTARYAPRFEAIGIESRWGPPDLDQPGRSLRLLLGPASWMSEDTLEAEIRKKSREYAALRENKRTDADQLILPVGKRQVILMDFPIEDFATPAAHDVEPFRHLAAEIAGRIIVAGPARQRKRSANMPQHLFFGGGIHHRVDSRIKIRGSSSFGAFDTPPGSVYCAPSALVSISRSELINPASSSPSMASPILI